MSFPNIVIWQKRNLLTRRLLGIVLVVSLASFNFGYDVSLFASVQGMQSFAKEFGEYDESLKLYALPAYLSSIMNSTPLAGKLIGALISGPLMEKYGRKIVLAIIGVASIIGVLLQCTSWNAAQFTVGRVLCYMATGLTVAVVPVYQSETSPAEIRGAIVATLQLWMELAQVIAAVITNATQDRPGRDAWLIPVSLQFIAPVAILFLYRFIPESPRWLLRRGRNDEAFSALKRVRPKSATDDTLHLELGLLLLAEQQLRTSEKSRWSDLLRDSNRRRTFISVGVMIGQQITGQAFVSQYSVVFFQQQHISSPSPFVLRIIDTVLNLFVGCVASLTTDTIGRRPMLNIGAVLMAIWLFVLGSLGSIADNMELVQLHKNVMITATILYSKAYCFSWGPLSYVIMGEVPSNQLREKTILISVCFSVVVTFLTSFTLPYLLNAPYANLGAKVGYVYGSLTVVTLIWSFFFLPETKGRALEELDEIFHSSIATSKFGSYISDSVGRQIHEAEQGEVAKQSHIKN